MNKFNPGDGVSIQLGTDTFPGTVLRTTKCTVTVQEDKAIRTDNNGMSECQSYTFERDPNGLIQVFHLRKNGYYYCKSSILRMGRHKYHDYSF